MTDGFALKSWVISLFNKASKKNSRYSTEESVIGTWINGKPLYRKVVKSDKLTYPNSKGRKKVYFSDLGIGNIPFDDVWIASGSFATYNHASINQRLPVLWSNSVLDLFSVFIDISAKCICLDAASDRSKYVVTLVLEYTKTTDKATL